MTILVVLEGKDSSCNYAMDVRICLSSLTELNYERLDVFPKCMINLSSRLKQKTLGLRKLRFREISSIGKLIFLRAVSFVQKAVTCSIKLRFLSFEPSFRTDAKICSRCDRPINQTAKTKTWKTESARERKKDRALLVLDERRCFTRSTQRNTLRA